MTGEEEQDPVAIHLAWTALSLDEVQEIARLA
jgi:hypothetical protein